KCSRVELCGIVKTVTSKDGVFGTHHLVDADIELIEVVGSCAPIEIILSRVTVGSKAALRVRQRIEARERQCLQRNGIEPVQRNDIAWKGIADNTPIDGLRGSRVVNGSAIYRPTQRVRSQGLRCQVARKITSTLFWSRHCCQGGVAAPQPETFIA